MLTDSKATQKFYESSTRTVYKHQAHQGPTLSLMAMKLVLNNAVVVLLDMKFTTEYSKDNVPTRKFASAKDTAFFRKVLHDDTSDGDLGKVLLLLRHDLGSPLQLEQPLEGGGRLQTPGG